MLFLYALAGSQYQLSAGLSVLEQRKTSRQEYTAGSQRHNNHQWDGDAR